MGTTSDEFIAAHIAEHESKFNQWCLVIGDVGILTGVLAMLRPGHRSVGAKLLLAGFGITTAGHMADRNLARELRRLWDHPLWTVQGDVAIIRRVLGHP